MTNKELDEFYLFHLLAGKLRGCYFREPSGSSKFENIEFWASESFMRERADLISCDLNESVLEDMTYEQFKITNNLLYLFDIDEPIKMSDDEDDIHFFEDNDY